MVHMVKDFSHLLGTLDGLSDAQLQAHFKLYEAYVKKLNEIEEKLQTEDRSLANYSYGSYSELKRREAVPFNGTYLHQMYFENLTAPGTEATDALKVALEKGFGSLANWETDLKAAASSTTGWVLLTWNLVDKSLHHYIMFEHHIGFPIHQIPLLALDCWEHAFMIDYGIKKPDYLAAFMKNLNWQVVNERFGALK